MEKEIQNMENLFTKQDAEEAVQRLADYFQNGKKGKNYFGLDDLGIINIYLTSKE